MQTFAQILFDTWKKTRDLKGNCDCVAWANYSDVGSPCVSWLPAPPIEAMYISAVRLIAPNRSARYYALASEIRAASGVQKLQSYEWFCKVLARLFYSESQQVLLNGYASRTPYMPQCRQRD